MSDTCTLRNLAANRVSQYMPIIVDTYTCAINNNLNIQATLGLHIKYEHSKQASNWLHVALSRWYISFIPNCYYAIIVYLLLLVVQQCRPQESSAQQLGARQFQDASSQPVIL